MPRYNPQDQSALLKAMIWLVAILLLTWMLLSPHGLWQYKKIAARVERLEEKNQELEKNNAELRREIERLQNDPEYIEEVARHKYNLLKREEIVFDFEKK